MPLPEEDRLPPVWLRDWQQIEADIQAMDDFAKKLRADIEKNYVSHLTPIYDSMSTALPQPAAGFPELTGLLEVHREATDAATNNVHDYANRTAHLAQAASEISSNYRGADAFSKATIDSVNGALDQAGVTGRYTGSDGHPTSGAEAYR